MTFQIFLPISGSNMIRCSSCGILIMRKGSWQNVQLNCPSAARVKHKVLGPDLAYHIILWPVTANQLHQFENIQKWMIQHLHG